MTGRCFCNPRHRGRIGRHRVGTPASTASPHVNENCFNSSRGSRKWLPKLPGAQNASEIPKRSPQGSLDHASLLPSPVSFSSSPTNGSLAHLPVEPSRSTPGTTSKADLPSPFSGPLFFTQWRPKWPTQQRSPLGEGPTLQGCSIEPSPMDPQTGQKLISMSSAGI